MDAIIHPGLPGMVTGQGKHFSIDIFAPDFQLGSSSKIAGFLTGQLPAAPRNLRPFFCSESALKAWRYIQGDEGGLNRDGA